MGSLAFLTLLYSMAAVAFAANERATATGKVVDPTGKPINHATILVYMAGVKKGFSVYCPTCWVDCGKHTLSDADGNYTITGLDPDLWFTLLAVHDGYAAAYVEKVDPAKGAAKDAVLKARPAIKNVSQIVRGRVVNAHGDPIKDAIVEQNGVTDTEGVSSFGPRDWIDQMVVTNQKGEFEIAYGKPAVRMILEVTARAMAPKLFTEPTGEQRRTMTVTQGAAIRGRLVYQGKPVANAEVGLFTHSRNAGTSFSEERIGTREDGTFVITNVPAGRIWYLYPKMESLASRNIGSGVILCQTKDDGEEVNLGDISLKPAYHLRGRITLNDANTIPPGMHVTISADPAWDSQIVPINPDGSFEFQGLPPGVYSIAPGVKGYRLSPETESEILIEHDVNSFAIHLQNSHGQTY